jgi:hypothetical protein
VPALKAIKAMRSQKMVRGAKVGFRLRARAL